MSGIVITPSETDNTHYRIRDCGNDDGCYVLVRQAALYREAAIDFPEIEIELPGKSCVDTNPKCPGWARRGYCTGRHEAYMQAKCKESCSAC